MTLKGSDAMKQWMPYYWQIPLAEDEIPMDKGGVRTVMMPDIKKVIKGLRECSIDDVDCKHCPYDGEGNQKYGCETVMQRDALKLLEKQKHDILEYQELCEHLQDKLKEQEQIVRCKDCRYYDSFSESCTNGIDGIMTPNFYCGNAEFKEGR